MPAIRTHKSKRRESLKDRDAEHATEARVLVPEDRSAKDNELEALEKSLEGLRLEETQTILVKTKKKPRSRNAAWGHDATETEEHQIPQDHARRGLRGGSDMHGEDFRQMHWRLQACSTADCTLSNRQQCSLCNLNF